MDTYQNINALVGENRIGEAISALDGMLKTDPEDSRALFERGKLFWRLGERHKAMGDYSAAASLGNTAAQMALDHAVDIDDFYNRDLYNP